MRLLKVPHADPSGYTSLELDNDAGRLFTAKNNGVIDIWDYKSLVDVCNLQNPSLDDVNKLTFIGSIDVHKGLSITGCKLWNKDFIISSDVEGKVYKTSISKENKLVESQLLVASSSRINDIALFGDVLFLATMNKVLAYDLVNLKDLSPVILRSDIRSICIDPFKNYLVSVAFNKTVLVNQIQFSNGDLQSKKVNNAYQNLKTINDILKFSWSEIGDKYALPNFNLDPNANAIGIISRKSWKNEFSLIGGIASIVKFNPKTFFDPTSKKPYNILASSGMDKSLVIWNTIFQRPLLTAADISKAPIQDLVWSDDGLSLLVSSDSLVVLVFEQNEFGELATEKLVQELKDKVPKPDKIPIMVPTESNNEKDSKQVAPSEKTNEPIVQAEESVTTASNTVPKPSAEVVKPSEPKAIELASAVTKNGKKRVAPTLISTVNGSKPAAIVAKTDSTTNGVNHTTMEFDKPSYSVPKDLKRKEEFNSTTEQQTKKKKEIEAVEFIGSVAINPSTSFSKLRISTPKIRSSFVLDSPNDETLSLDIRNGSGNEQKPTRITLFKNSTKQVFVDFISKLVGLATGGEGYFWAISTLEGVIHVYGDSGRRIFPPLVIGTPLSFLESKGKYLLAVSSIGEVFVWDVESKKALFEPTSLYPLLSRSNPDLLTRAENLTLCGISSSGIPIVTVSNGNGYLYDCDMGSWSLISDSWWAFGSQYWDATDKRAISGSIINLLEKKTNEEIVRRGRGKFLQKMAKTMLMKEGYENLEKTISLAHLENRILISRKLKEEAEFKNYLTIYCKRISELGFKARLQEIFQDLLGPKIPDPNWESKILSLDKHELLRELIFACANIRAVQRILIPFATSLNILEQTNFQA